jgi:hypothetical protein
MRIERAHKCGKVEPRRGDRVMEHKRREEHERVRNRQMRAVAVFIAAAVLLIAAVSAVAVLAAVPVEATELIALGTAVLLALLFMLGMGKRVQGWIHAPPETAGDEVDLELYEALGAVAGAARMTRLVLAEDWGPYRDGVLAIAEQELAEALDRLDVVRPTDLSQRQAEWLATLRRRYGLS